MYGKIGVPFCTLLIILFRMAQFLFIPQNSPITPPILGYLELFINFISCWFLKLDTWASTYVVLPVLQLVSSFLPLVLFRFAIWCSNLLFYPLMWIIWWTMYLSAVWKYLGVTGRSFTEMLAAPQGNTATIELRAHGAKPACEVTSDIRVSFLAAHDLWYTTIQYYQTSIQHHDRCLRGRLRQCHELQRAAFWLYATFLFGSSVCYFLWRILAYKCGWLQLPQLKGWRKNRRKRQRGFYRQRRFERWRCRRRHCSRHSILNVRRAGQEAASRSAAGSGVFTTVLNIDKRTNERSSLTFDTDSTTVVCDNSANVHVCNDKKSFVGELQPVTGHQVATTGGRSHAPSDVGTV